MADQVSDRAAERVDELLEASVEGRSDLAAALLAADPDLHLALARFDVHTAAALGEADHLASLLAADPVLATAPDDRRGWPPLLYACHSCWHRIDRRRGDGLLRVVRQLLDAGASPDTSNGRPSREGYRSALYGAAGIANNPAITRLLLERGADPDDDESLYHSAYHAPDLECTRLLLEHGATVDGTNALGAMLDTGSVEGVRLLLDHGALPSGDTLPGAIQRHCAVPIILALLDAGADPASAGCHPVSPLRLAVLTGQPDVAALLRERGAATTADDTTAADQLVGACMLADRDEATRLLSAEPDLVTALPEQLAGSALVHAAEYAGPASLQLMLDLGFPVDARGAPFGGTALHHAAYNGRAALVRLLLGRGADVAALDANWTMTALGWAIVASSRDHSPGPDTDLPATVEALLDAGSPTQDAWHPDATPSAGVQAALRDHGVHPTPA